MNFPLLKRAPATQDSAQSGAVSAPGKKKKRLPVKRIVAVVLICALVVGLGLYFLRGRRGADQGGNATYTTSVVTRGDITSTITGSGSLSAADSYSVTTLLEDTILTADFEEGDQVEAGQVLYTIDSSDAASSLEQSEISLQQAQRSYQRQLENQADLKVTATAAGQVYTLDVEVGDQVNAGQTVATIRDSDTMSLEVTFPADEADAFSVGQSAVVTLDSTFETLSGTISKINGNTIVLDGNVMVRTVTIEVSNPGGLSTTQSASAAVGSVTSTGSGTFTYGTEKPVTANVSGEVSAVRVTEGDRVSKGDVLVVLTSDSVTDSVQNASESLRNAEINLESRYEKLDDYTITAPIQGTIIDKNYNAGEITESNQVLCTIYDLSYLTMTLSVDELDIADIQVGQTVEVTADAVEGKTYEGVVTKVSVAGTYSGGVTTYPVTIRIDETEGLLPGMNVDATIVLESASDVLTIPSAALQRGNTVLLTADSPSAAGGEANENGYVSVQVTTGVGDDSNLEVLSGLQEGDTVVYIQTSSSSNDMSMMMGGMPGGDMGGGGMPSGGGGGGMPGGGGGGGGGMPGGR
jgi:HlyD family secretion protein